jgi:hypothetical protein
MKKRALKKKARPSARAFFAAVIAAALAGCALTYLGGWWIAAGRIDYWTGPTEKHHFVASPSSWPGAYWTLVLLYCVGAALLWVKIIADLIGWLRSRSVAQNGGPVNSLEV